MIVFKISVNKIVYIFILLPSPVVHAYSFWLNGSVCDNSFAKVINLESASSKIMCVLWAVYVI